MTRTIDPVVDDIDRRLDELLRRCPPEAKAPDVFLGEQFDLGLAWVHFEPGFGGLGVDPKHQRRIEHRISAAGGPSCADRNPIGYGMCAPTLHDWGTDECKRRHLRPLFTCAEIWCQLFSEPGAGSDFAGLATRAVRDGDEWVVNGQKVWTTLAHVSRFGLLVARTDPQEVKHAGLTAFIVDMRAPGVDVRPLRQITGEAEFNEVYFTDTRIPDRCRLGGPGDGWRVSLTTLMNERTSIGGSVPARGSGTIRHLMEVWGALPADRRDAVARDAVIRLWIRAEVLRLTNARASEQRRRGSPGPEGSIGKMASASLNQAIHDQVMTLLGADALLCGSDATVRPTTAGGATTAQQAFLRSRANTIEGGTTEVMKNILGERVLGLAGDVRVDRDVPWVDVPR